LRSWNNKLSEVSLLLKKSNVLRQHQGQKMLAGGPNFGTVNFFAACAGLSPAGRESKRENAEGYGLQAVR
jgi:hypothetical protein